MILLDTHILVDAFDGRLRGAEETKLRADAQWAVADITLWELSMLYIAGRIAIDVASAEGRNAIAPLRIYPITVEIAHQSCRLDFKTDPADHLIAATSIVHNVPLMTRDRAIRTSKLVRFA
ncbi:MAG TPA: PIN domain-containing protein [Polyangiales bacterium]|nr:PIN domain-containing protein [Polyangiales bacterium]